MYNVAVNLVVCISGALVMLLELLGSRIFAPFLGTTLYVWTSVIGVVMAGLALGYYVGGRIADRSSDPRVLSLIFLGAAFSVIFLSFSKDFLLIHFEFSELTLLYKSLLASLIIFGPMNIFFGMVVPFAVKLSYTEEKEVGSVAGRIYALSTLGSIFGTFFAGFYLIPSFGIQNLLVGVSIVLLSLALCTGWQRFSTTEKIFSVFFFVVLSIVAYLSLTFSYTEEGISMIADINTTYSRILVRDVAESGTGRPIRIFANNQAAIYMDTKEPDRGYFDYIQFLRLFEHLKPDFKNVLMLGGAAYTLPHYVSVVYPERPLTVVEIDSKQIEIAKKYFKFVPSQIFRNVSIDGRTFFNQNTDTYDVIVLDAYGGGGSPPFELTTEEFFKKTEKALSLDGILLSNIISAVSGDSAEFLRAEVATLRSVFPYVYVFPVGEEEYRHETQNIILVASKESLEKRLSMTVGPFARQLSHLILIDEIKPTFVLKDDYAPVEHMVLGFKQFVDF